MKASILFLGLCALAMGQVNANDYQIIVCDRVGTSTGIPWTSWSTVGASAVDWNPLSRTAFGVRKNGQELILSGARVALFARVVAPSETQDLVNAHWPTAGIDLSPLAETSLTLPPNSACILADNCAQMQVAPSAMTELVALCGSAGGSSTSVPTAVNAYTAPMVSTYNASFGGSGTSWPALQAGWTNPSFNSAVWTPAYDSRYAGQTNVPGGQIFTYNLSRLAERLVLRQSVNQAEASAFLRSTLLGTAVSNQMIVQMQACIILPQIAAAPGPRHPVIITNVFEVYIELIPGDTPNTESNVSLACGESPALDASAISQAGIVYDGGPDGPMVLTLGNGNVPTAVYFDAGGCVGAPGVALNPLFPLDPYCPYWVVFRPYVNGLPVTGKVSGISLLPRLEPPESIGSEGTPTMEPIPVDVLPPRPDAVPLFDVPAGGAWWELLPLLL